MKLLVDADGKMAALKDRTKAFVDSKKKDLEEKDAAIADLKAKLGKAVVLVGNLKAKTSEAEARADGAAAGSSSGDDNGEKDAKIADLMRKLGKAKDFVGHLNARVDAAEAELTKAKETGGGSGGGGVAEGEKDAKIEDLMGKLGKAKELVGKLKGRAETAEAQVGRRWRGWSVQRCW